MIVFKGEITEESRNYIERKIIISAFIAIPIMFIFISLPIVLIALLVSKYLFFGLIITFALAVINYLKEFGQYPNCIEIDDYEIRAFNKRIKLNNTLKNISTVIDMGTFYTFKFNLKMNKFFVCQKDLIVEGSIEEFEKLFEDKLIRKEQKT